MIEIDKIWLCTKEMQSELVTLLEWIQDVAEISEKLLM